MRHCAPDNNNDGPIMLITPVDRPFNWKQPPRLALGLSLVLSIIFVFWHSADLRREQALEAQYVKELLPVEWPLYETHLLKEGQRTTLDHLKAARARGDTAALTAYLGADDKFANSLRATGKDFLADDVLSAWQKSRDSFDHEHTLLSYQALGVDPENFRPITFLTFNLVQPDAIHFLGVILLLLTAGIALELALGSGAVLAAFLGGGVTGAIVYLVVNGGGVLPLSGAGAAVAGITGMYTMHFRTQPVKYFGAVQTTALIVPLLWLAWLMAEFFFATPRPAEIAAQVAGLASGPLWYLIYQRWFAHAEVEPETVAEEADSDETWREQLAQALDAVGRMEFVEAQKRLRELVKARPQDLRVITQLYQLEKLDPNSTTYDAVSRRLFQLGVSTEEGAYTALKVYRDYDKLSLDKRALDTETSLKLVMRFSRLGEVKDAEKIMKALLGRKATHPLLSKASLALAQAFEQLHDPARAEQYRDIAAHN